MPKSPPKQKGRPVGSAARVPTGSAAQRPLKTCDLVALDIVRDIVARNLAPGEGLPSEQQMLARYRTGRTSLREALRILEVQGLIAIRAGRGTGTTVGTPDPRNLARTLTLYLNMFGATYEDVLNAWAITEPLLAHLAAQNKNRPLKRKMLSAFLADHRPDDKAWTTNEGEVFHNTVATLADNPVLSLSLSAIGAIQSAYLLTIVQGQQMDDTLVHDHMVIAKAIIAGDAENSRKLMEVHIQHIVDEFKTYWPRQVGERIQWR